MKKFLEDLKKELHKRNVNQTDIEEIILDHEEMIEAALAKGLNESEIIAQLGNPKSLADELSDFSEKNKNDEIDYSAYQLWNKFAISEKDFSIFVELVSESVTFKESEDNDLSIFYKGSKNIDDYDLLCENNVFKLSAQKQFGISFFKRTNNNMEFLIEVPKEIKIENLKLKSVSSKLEFMDLNVEDFLISTTSGDVKISNCHFDKAKWNTVSGDIQVINSKMISVNSSQVSGDLSFENVTVHDRAELNTVSGDVEIENVSCDAFEFRSVSGDVNAQDFYPKTIVYRSVSGDVIVKNSNDSHIEILKKSSVSGQIKIQNKKN